MLKNYVNIDMLKSLAIEGYRVCIDCIGCSYEQKTQVQQFLIDNECGWITRRWVPVTEGIRYYSLYHDYDDTPGFHIKKGDGNPETSWTDLKTKVYKYHEIDFNNDNKVSQIINVLIDEL